MQLCGAIGVGYSGGSIAWSRWKSPTNLLVRGRLGRAYTENEGRNVRFVEF
jgi:hypothetical protein